MAFCVITNAVYIILCDCAGMQTANYGMLRPQSQYRTIGMIGMLCSTDLAFMRLDWGLTI